jgi:hypothetical protein
MQSFESVALGVFIQQAARDGITGNVKPDETKGTKRRIGSSVGDE